MTQDDPNNNVCTIENKNLIQIRHGIKMMILLNFLNFLHFLYFLHFLHVKKIYIEKLS